MNDELIIQKFITDKNKINSHYKQIINKNQEIKEYLDNPPCKNCEYSTSKRLIGCLRLPSKCEEYQEYSLLCELTKYFKTCEYKS